MKRTHLPLNGLRVLDAAARHLSFTRAADELAVTPAAVGQQIRALEDLLGVILFRRTSKGLELTDEALSGLDSIREGFLRFEEGVQSMQAGQSSHVYTIACPRDFFAAWLSPRLAAFRAGNPQMRFSLVGGDVDIDFAEANLDLAVRWAEGPGDLEGLPLGEAKRVTVGEGGWISWPGDPNPQVVIRVPSSPANGCRPARSGNSTCRTGLSESFVTSQVATIDLLIPSISDLLACFLSP